MESKTKKPTTAKTITVKLIHSAIGTNPTQRKTLVALGLKKINQVKTYPDNEAIRGMLNIVSHLVLVEQ
ncbi:MAG: 50S ribosomal protein L30 [Clostridia bacterium]|nr:50S ribosomal protein L30 [Clostridia bacterium]